VPRGCREAGVESCAGPAEALDGAALVFCLVTADQAMAAAEAAAPHLAPDALWLDGNSCSPERKGAAARRAGVETAVLASLQASDPALDWERRVDYNLERMMVHGIRRGAEMREVAATLRELRLPDRLAAATATWQEEIGALGLGEGAAEIAARADRLLDRLP
jgi:Domain of unknown function (DUF1932)